MSTDTTTATLWLAMLGRDSPLTAPEAVQIVEGGVNLVGRILYSMSKKGLCRPCLVTSTRKNGKGYTVDAACVIPRGIALHRVLEHAGLGNLDVSEAQPEPEPVDKPLPPRGTLGHIGRVSSVFALSGRLLETRKAPA